MRKRSPAPAAPVPRPVGPLTPAEEERVRTLLRSRPSSADLAQLDAIAGAERVVPGFLLGAKHWDAEPFTSQVLHALLLHRHSDSWDYWRAL